MVLEFVSRVLFPAVCRMSMTASAVILLVLAVRLLLKWAPKVFSYLLWAVVLFRLLCPVSVTSDFSMLGFVDVPEPVPAVREQVQSHVVVPPVQAPVFHTDIPAAAAPQKTVQHSVLPVLWLAGVGVMALYSIGSLWKLRRRLVGAVRLEGNIWLADHIHSPFVMGLLRPKIYLPSSLPQQKYIVLHEQYHIRRRDHLVKFIAFAALCLHWFNPLVWLAFVLAGEDMEMSCDEAVLKQLGPEICADYSASLLSLAAGRRTVSGTLLAFGEGNPKGRIKNVLAWRKPKRWAAVCAAVLCLAAAAACAADPKAAHTQEPESDTQTLPAQSGNSPLATFSAGKYDRTPLTIHYICNGRNQGSYETSYDDLPDIEGRVWTFDPNYPVDHSGDDYIVLTQGNQWSLTVYPNDDVMVKNKNTSEMLHLKWLYDTLQELYEEAEDTAPPFKEFRRDAIVIPDRGQGYLEAAAEFCQAYEELHLTAPRRERFTFVQTRVTDAGDTIETADGNTAYCFHMNAICVPENEVAREWAYGWAYLAEDYTGSDPDIPEGALEYHWCGYITLEDDGWHGFEIGIVW